jgi:hypothetical protein
MICTPKLKFHCEFSPVEGFWCFSKDHVRKYNDQNYETMKRLINEAFAIYKDLLRIAFAIYKDAF